MFPELIIPNNKIFDNMLDKLALVVLLMTVAVCEESSILANI